MVYFRKDSPRPTWLDLDALHCVVAPCAAIFSAGLVRDVTAPSNESMRSVKLRRNAVQKARSSDGPTSTPSTWRSPLVLIPTATTVPL
jgi:hypothetical protein